MTTKMNSISKVLLAAITAVTLVSSVARADDNALRQGGPGVVISQGNQLGSQLAHDAQGE